MAYLRVGKDMQGRSKLRNVGSKCRRYYVEVYFRAN
jgi:hypothetical protein